MRQSACRGSFRVTWRPATCNVRGGEGEWSLRHVQRRVQLTLGLGRRETGACLGTTAPHDLPAAVLRLQRLRGAPPGGSPQAWGGRGAARGGGCFGRRRGNAGGRSRGAMIRSPGSSSSTSVSRYGPAALSSSSRTASSPISSSSSRVRVFLY